MAGQRACGIPTDISFGLWAQWRARKRNKRVYFWDMRFYVDRLGKAILDRLPIEGESWVVPPKANDSLVWRDRDDLRNLDICSIVPPGKLVPFIQIDLTSRMSGHR